ncbi:MAG: EamA family transporter [Firmicutes bacterium]|nr:EamA family transporter [Bacillota bacterium]
MAEHHDGHSYYILLPILAGTCWGMAGIFVRELAKAGLDNPTIVFTRTSVCALLTFLYILLADRRRKPPGPGPKNRRSSAPEDRPRSLLYMKPADLPYAAAIAVFGSVLLMIAYNIAAIRLSLSLAAILLCTAPAFVLLISAALFHEKITRRKVLCMIVAFIGCAMLSGIFGGGLQWSSFGLLMGLAAALCNSIYIIMSKAIATKGYHSFTISFWSALFASVILAFFIDWHALAAYLAGSPFSSSIFLLVQSVCTSLLPSIAYIIAMRHVEAGRTAILQSGAEPTAAFVAGLLIYREIPTAFGLAGMIITIIALMVLAGDRSS